MVAIVCTLMAINFRQQYKHFKAWQLRAFDWSFDKNEHHWCVNCENDFVGNHCPYCSQKAGMGKVSWASVVQSTAEVWGMHNRSLLYSLWQLMFRPGYFISDYINGKRQVSFPPVKMLLIMGVISLIVDHLFVVTDVTKEVVKSSSPLVQQFFAWLEENPGWGWLTCVCFFLIPTWYLFRYAPRNAKHSLPQGFFIQVFMSVQVLIVDDLADFFTDYFYLLVPLCYFYTYRQLFAYGFWGNFWRVLLMLVTGFMSVMLAVSITELIVGETEKTLVSSIETIGGLLALSVGPLMVGMIISKMAAGHRKPADKKV